MVEHLDAPLVYFEMLRTLLKSYEILAVLTLFYHMDNDYFRGWYSILDWSDTSFYMPKTMEVISKKVGLRMIHTNGVRYTTVSLDNVFLF